MKVSFAFCPGVPIATVTAAPLTVIVPERSAGTDLRANVEAPTAAPSGSILTAYTPATGKVTTSDHTGVELPAVR